MKWLIVLAVVCPLAAAPVDFDRDIRPIVSDNCYACHGPDEKKRMANLRLDIPDGGIQRVVTAGDSGKSRLFQRVSAADKARRMPPPFATTTLTPKQVELIK